MRLEGHTDSRASVAYNLALERRVNATKAVFLALGVDSTRISTDFKGKGDLYEEKDTRGFALNRRVEMVFVDSDGRDIKGERQEGDLQLEAATAGAAEEARGEEAGREAGGGQARGAREAEALVRRQTDVTTTGVRHHGGRRFVIGRRARPAPPSPRAA